MIQRLSHLSRYVLDQDAAYDFYVNKLGFEVRMDNKLEGSAGSPWDQKARRTSRSSGCKPCQAR